MSMKIEGDPSVVNPKSHNTKAISLVFELHDLEHALAALGIVLSSAAEEIGTVKVRETVGSGVALANLVQHHIELLRRAVSGDIDPSFVWTPKNEPGVIATDSDAKDFILYGWTPEQRADRIRSL